MDKEKVTEEVTKDVIEEVAEDLVETEVAVNENGESLKEDSNNETNITKIDIVEESTDTTPESIEVNSSDTTVDVDEDDDYDYGEPTKGDKLKGTLLWIALVIVILGFVALFYRFYPLTSKVSGTWTASTTNGVFKVTNDGKQSTFVMEDISGNQGMDMVFLSELGPKGENEYVVKNTQMFLELDREVYTDDIVNQMIGDGSLLKSAMQTDKITRLKYTKKGIEQTFPGEDLNKMFKYVLKDFNWKMQGETLSLINGSFAQGGVPMSRE